MRGVVVVVLVWIFSLTYASGQSVQLAFNEAANFYIQGKFDKAKSTVEEGLRKEPSNRRLRALYEKLKKEEEQRKEQEKQQQEQQQKQQQQQQQQQNQQNQQQNQQKSQNQQSQEDQNQEQSGTQQQQKDNKEGKGEKKEDEKKEEGKNENKQEESKEGEKKDKSQTDEGKPLDEAQLKKQRQQEVARKLKDLNLSEEKARMILEAMRANEVQYLQQRKRRPVYVPDKSKPDW